MTHPSDSSTQLDAEGLIRAKVADVVGVPLSKKKLPLGASAHVEIDAVDDGEQVLVEIYAHQGVLKGGQKHKVKGDVLKMITLGRTRPSARLILAFGDEKAAAFVLGEGWVGEAVKVWGIEVVVVELDEEVKKGLEEAQVHQVMVNPPSE